MSAPQVGQVYQKIIDDVINDSASSFDEDGVERRLLDDLRRTWQDKLSARRVADMPWDPPPVPTPLTLPQTNGTSGPVNGVSSTPAPSSTTANPVVKAEPVIKQEPSYTEYPAANVVPASQPAASLQRAGQYIQDKFGTAANESLTALQSAQAARLQHQQQQIQQQGQQAQQAQHAQAQSQLGNLPMGMSSDASRQAYNRMLAEQMRAQQARAANQQRTVAGGQTDGADEWRAFAAERRALSEKAIGAADMTLRQFIEQDASVMEGGGLMLPISQIKPSLTASIQRDPKTRHAQFDGADSDDDKKLDDDEDAINSDLDDPDDDPGVNSEEEGNNGEVMVCLYDKVQRVKNKWKCTLKDGILSTGGKEYVFGKAQGEFEW